MEARVPDRFYLFGENTQEAKQSPFGSAIREAKVIDLRAFLQGQFFLPLEQVPVLGSAEAGAEESSAEKFTRLTERWYEERRLLPPASKLRDALALKPYRRIVGMGKEALPFLAEQMRAKPDWWFDALDEITDMEPERVVSDEIRGDLQAMTDAWLAFLEAEGYI